MKKVFYRLITPGTFADRNCVTLEDAQERLIEFGSTPENVEHYQYWQDQMRKCKIVKVTEIIEDVDL